MFSKILLATSVTNASDHAARVAFNMASKYNGHLTIFHVMGVPTRGFSYYMMDVKTNTQIEFDDDYIDWVKEEIKDYYSKQLKMVLSYDIKVAIGRPYREILGIARQSKPSIIVLGGTTDSDLKYKRKLIGSVIHEVTKLATCPVLLVNRPSASFWGGISNVVFVTDLSVESKNAFQIAFRLVEQFKCEIHIFNVLDIGLNSFPQDMIDLKIRETMKKIREEYLADVDSLDIRNCHINVWEGIPYVETVKYARENHADLIVIARNHKKRFDEIEGLETNIEQIIARANCPVLSV